MNDPDELQFIVNHVGRKHKTCKKLIEEARDHYKLSKEPVAAPVHTPKPLLEEARERNAVRNNFIKKETERIEKEFDLPTANARTQAEQAWSESEEKKNLERALNASRKQATDGYFQEEFEVYNTIEKIDAYIGRVTADKKKGITGKTGSISDTIPSFCKKKDDAFVKRVCSWKLNKSSGNENNCLVHTFLTMISPNFRKLQIADKNTIVGGFRRTLMPKLPAGKLPLGTLTASNELIKGTGMLTDTEIDRLLNTYGLNAIVFEHSRAGQPDNVNVLTRNETNDKYFLISLKGAHYEAVSTETGEFTIPIETALEIGEKFKQGFTGEAKLKCDFDEGDKVTYKGSEYFIIERQSDGASPPSCISVTLVNKADYDKYLKLKDIGDSKRNETSYRAREFGSIQNKVSISEIKLLFEGGKRRATRRRGAAAKRRSLRRRCV